MSVIRQARGAAVVAADRLSTTLGLAKPVAQAAQTNRLGPVARWLHDVPGAFLRPGDHAIVAGVWTPRTARRYAHAVGNTGRLLVLEANQETGDKLAEELGDLPQVTVINRALWKDDSGVEFFHAPVGEYQGFNRVSATGVPDVLDTMVEGAVRSMIPSVGLDDLGDEISFAKLRHISMTINGSEVEALEHSNECLSKAAQLFVATWTEYPEFGPRVEAALTNNGFDVATSTGRGAKNRWSDLDLRYVLGFKPGTNRT